METTTESQDVCNTQKLEIMRPDSHKCRLTVTPTRITVKIPVGISDEKAHEIVEFGKFVAKQLGQVTNSWRGNFSVRNDYRTIIMHTGQYLRSNHDNTRFVNEF